MSAFQFPPPENRQDVPIEEEISVEENPDLLHNNNTINNKKSREDIKKDSEIATRNALKDLNRMQREKMIESSDSDDEEENPTVTLNFQSRKKNKSNGEHITSDIFEQNCFLQNQIMELKTKNADLSRKNQSLGLMITELETGKADIKDKLEESRKENKKMQSDIVICKKFNAEVDSYLKELYPLDKKIEELNHQIYINRNNDKNLCMILGCVKSFEEDLNKFSKIDFKDYKFLENKTLSQYFKNENQKRNKEISKLKNNIQHYIKNLENENYCISFVFLILVICVIGYLFIKVY